MPWPCYIEPMKTDRITWLLRLLGLASALVSADAPAQRDSPMNRTDDVRLPAQQNHTEWYRDSVVNLHIDNHSSLVGQGHTVEELAAMIRDIPVDMVQVSAYGAVGHMVTYPTERLPELLHPQLAGFDTLGVWREAVASCGKRFHVYLNTRGLRIHLKHPQWMQQNAAGRGRGRGEGLYDACPRPAPNGDGYLEQILLPLLEEVSALYGPGGFWVDGDHARTHACYCPNCREAWRRHSGKADPPTDPKDPDWPAWLRLEQERYDAYRCRMADVVHRANPRTMYTSNHSWRKTYSPTFEKIDPRDPPADVDALSADLSHGISLRETRLSAMLLSADQATAHDIMHLVDGDKITLGRVLQQGALTLSFGGPWFLWCRGSGIVRPQAQERVTLCARFARDREAACGRSVSRNPYAVLVSETTWLAERCGEEADGTHDYLAANAFALAFQDAACSVDLVNESLLRRHAAGYRLVVVPNQRDLAPETVTALREFVQKGGSALVTGGAMRAGGTEDDSVTRWLGLRRVGREPRQAQLALSARTVVPGSTWRVELGDAETLATFVDGRPALTRKPHGKGAVHWLNVDRLPCPDVDGIVPWAMGLMGAGPCFCIDAPTETPHLVMAVRRKTDLTVLHLTDLTSRSNGRRVRPEKSDIIDDATAIPELRVSVPVSRAPTAVRAVPENTTVSHSWRDGVLSLTLRDLFVHSAVLLEGLPDRPARLLPADTPLPQRFAWAHYSTLRTLHLSFEAEDHGHKLDPFADCVVRSHGACTIRASKETASEGRYSAKFSDGPDPRSFMPYLFVKPSFLAAGTVRCTVDLRIGKGAQPSLELRTVENRRENPVGPSLRVGPDGTLSTEQGRKLLLLPHNQWVRLEITCVLGSGRYDLRVTLPGAQTRDLSSLPCVGGTAFTRCTWIGICSNARERTVFYVDNLRVDGD